MQCNGLNPTQTTAQGVNSLSAEFDFEKLEQNQVREDLVKRI